MRSLLFIIVMALAPAASQAAEVSVLADEKDKPIAYQAAPGEVNKVRAGAPAGIANQLRVSDPGIPVTVAATASSCTSESTAGFLCTGGPKLFIVLLDDGDDVFAGSASATVFMVEGGIGEDVIRNASQAQGDDGDDTLVAPGADSILDGNDGDDILTGYLGEDIIGGGAGADRIRGGGGRDEARGGDGNDVIDGGPGQDRIYGEKGNDKLSVGAGAANFADGGAGRDTINARNRQRDRINCGPGRGDVATVDEVDRVRNCETVRIRR
ncbi:MAG: hypothetical protein H0V29_01910 [Thermoleophilaceae bacterium]|nr:hypothetical protein [Thermoleophilaceae bacterium]